MKDIDAVLRAHSLQLRDEFPWVWLYEVRVPTSPATRIRITNFTRSVNFGSDSLGNPITYSPFPVDHGDIEQNSKGDLRGLTIAVGNVSREVNQILYEHGGLIGQPALIRLVNSAALNNAQAELAERSLVQDVQVTDKIATFTLSPFNLYQRQFPPYRVTRSNCSSVYGSAECGYDLTTPGALTSCSKLKEGTNGCRAHGDAEVTAGLPRLHPQRFNAFPGIARR